MCPRKDRNKALSIGLFVIALSLMPASEASAQVASSTCAGAPVVAQGVYTGTTAGATHDGSATCGDSDLSPDVYYAYEASCNGTLVASTCTGTSYDTVLSAYSSCPGTTSNELICNDDTCGFTSQISIPITAGSTYRIRVSGYGGDSGAFALTLAATCTEVNPCLGDGTFQAVAQYTVSNNAGQVAVGHFNNDARADLAVATTADNVSVLLNDNNGTFPVTAHYTVAQGGNSLMVGDFNADHREDLVSVTNAFPYYVTIMAGNGDGTFQGPVGHLLGRQGSIGAVADFNGDLKDDLAVLIVDGDVEVWLGNGDGTFQAALKYNIGFGLVPSGMALGDFNGDQNADLAVTISNTDSVAVLLGDGGGSFSAAPNRHLPAGVASPTGVAVGDFNGDNKDDLAVANALGAAVSVLLGDGSGGFPSGINYPVGIGSFDVVVGDVDGDTIDDLAVANFSSNTVSVLKGTGSGSFQPAVNYAVTQAYSIAAGDFNGDGKSDLAVTQGSRGTVSVLLSSMCNAPPEALCADVTVPAGSSCSGSASIDNGSSDPDAGDTITLDQTPAGPYPLGATTVTLTVTDSSSVSSQCQATVTVLDETPPSITCPGPITKYADPGVCGASAGFAAAASDNCAVGIAYDIAGAPIVSPHIFAVGTTTVQAVAADSAGHSVGCSFNVTVLNPDPVVTLTGPPSGSLYPIGSPVGFTATFTDAGGGTHTGTWNFDAHSQAAAITEPAGATPGTATASYAFDAAGVYHVALTIDDSCGGTATADEMSGMEVLVIVYDPSAGFVTGGGWIDSPPGAYQPDPSLSGRANFGFVSRYQKGAVVPTGETEFQFKVTNINFRASVYQWLVVSGPKAQYKGTGTINGAGTYSFLLTATDGDVSGGGGVDRYRIKITGAGGGVVYDNVPGGSDDIDNAGPQAIGGGSIVIHK